MKSIVYDRFAIFLSLVVATVFCVTVINFNNTQRNVQVDKNSYFEHQENITLYEITKSIITRKAGAVSEQQINRIDYIDISNNEDNTKNISIVLNGDEMNSSSATREKLFDFSKKILISLFRYKEVQELNITWSLSNNNLKETGTALFISMDRDTYESMRLSKYKPENLRFIAN